MIGVRAIHRAMFSAVAIATAIGSLGCAGSVLDRSVLPEDVIAVRLWKNEDARRRKEAKAKLGGQRETSQRLGVVDIGGLSARLRESEGADPVSRYPGRLALINPRTLSVTFPDQAPPGARPLSWSADRERLMFSSNRQSGRYQVYELDFRTGEVKLLHGGHGNFLAAAHAPDSGFVYGSIRRDKDGEFQTQILKRHSGVRDRVLAENVAIRHISYSRDGRYVAYAPQNLEAAEARERRPPLMVVQEVDPGGARRQLGPGEHPVFSPNGDWIIYSARRGALHYTHRVRVDGAGRTPMGIGVRSEETPAISPDGEFVVYVSEHNGLNRLFVKRFDGTGDRLLYDGAAVEWPVW